MRTTWQHGNSFDVEPVIELGDGNPVAHLFVCGRPWFLMTNANTFEAWYLLTNAIKIEKLNDSRCSKIQELRARLEGSSNMAMAAEFVKANLWEGDKPYSWLYGAVLVIDNQMLRDVSYHVLREKFPHSPIFCLQHERVAVSGLQEGLVSLSDSLLLHAIAHEQELAGVVTNFPT